VRLCAFGKVICRAAGRSNVGFESILQISGSNLDVDCVVGVRAWECVCDDLFCVRFFFVWNHWQIMSDMLVYS